MSARCRRVFKAFIVLYLALCGVCPALAGPVSIVDDGGETIRLERPARRVIALYGAFNEILLAMGQGSRIIARTAADAEIPELADLPGIGTHMRPSLEMAAALGPDLVLQMGGRNEALESVHALRRLGITTAFFRVADFEDLFRLIERLGVLTGSDAEAARLSAALQARLSALDTALAPVRQAGEDTLPTVFFELRYPGLIGAGQGAMVNDIILRAGGRNCLAFPSNFLTDAPDQVVRVSEEELIRVNPDVYLIQRGPMNKSPVPLAERPHFAPLAAVKNGAVHIVDERLFSRPGPRSVDAAEALARILHPRLFPEGVTP